MTVYARLGSLGRAENETFDVGLDARTPLTLVEYRYDVPFKFTGKIDELIFRLQ